MELSLFLTDGPLTFESLGQRAVDSYDRHLTLEKRSPAEFGQSIALAFFMCEFVRSTHPSEWATRLVRVAWKCPFNFTQLIEPAAMWTFQHTVKGWWENPAIRKRIVELYMFTFPSFLRQVYTIATHPSASEAFLQENAVQEYAAASKSEAVEKWTSTGLFALKSNQVD